MLPRMTSRLALAALLILSGVGLDSGAQSNTTQPSQGKSRMEEPDEYSYGNPLDEEERAIVAALTPDQVKAIDAALLEDVSARWTKVAKVLGKQLKAKPGNPVDVPLEYYWQRPRHFVDAGELESQGDVRRARFSEVRRR